MMTPDLLDRYLQAVSFWLPNPQRRDIVAEISGDLHAQVDEKHAGLGRELTETEVEEILTRWGHPMLVAQRYLPQRYLIGPVLFPVYTLVLKLVLLCYILPWLVVWIGLVIFMPGYPGPDAVSTLRPLLLSGLWVFALVTAVFAGMERSQAQTGYWEAWTAARLRGRRPAPEPDHISRWSSVTELVLGFLLCSWWLQLSGTSPAYTLVPNVLRVIVRPVHRGFYWPILFMLLAGIAMAAVNLARPQWTRRRAAVKLAISAFGFVVVALLLASGPIVEVLAVDASRPGLQELAKWINVSWWISLLVVGLAWLAEIVRALRRVLGKKPPENRAVTFMTGDPH